MNRLQNIDMKIEIHLHKPLCHFKSESSKHQSKLCILRQAWILPLLFRRRTL